MAAEQHTVSLRLGKELHGDATAAAALLGQTISDFVREAIHTKVEQVRLDPKLQDRARVLADDLAIELEGRIATLRRLGSGEP